MTNPPRKHHFIPEFYSRQWGDAGTGELVRFSPLPGDRFEARRVTPAAVGYERDLYTIPAFPMESAQRLESVIFSNLDNHAARIMSSMIKNGAPTDSDQRSTWARFLMAFWYRAPDDLDAMKEAWSIGLRRDPLLGPVNADELAAYILVHLPNQIDNPNMGRVIINMTWTVLDLSASSVTLLTSDNPVIRSNGLNPPEGNYSIPISPRHMFIASWPGEMLNNYMRHPPTKLVRAANKIIVNRARRFILSTDDRQRNFVEKHFGKERVPSPIESILTAYRANHPDTF